MFTCDPRCSRGELSCLSGPCIEIPCIDRYSPNHSCCCCVLPRYDDEIFAFDDFFDKVLPELHTGDAVLASWPVEQDSGTGLSRCMGHSRWSHVGLIYRPSDCPSVLKHRDLKYPDEVHESRPLMLHMIAGGECGHRIHREQGGLDILDFEVYVKDYLDKFQHNPVDFDPATSSAHLIGVRKMTNFQRSQDFYGKFEAALDAHDAKYFKSGMSWNTMASQIDCCEGLVPYRCMPWAAREQLERLFCSVLVAEVLKGTDLLDPRLLSSEFVPAMWGTTRRLLLEQGAKLSMEYVVVGPVSEEERMHHMKYPPREGSSSGGGGCNVSCDDFGSGGFWGVDVTRPIGSAAPVGNFRLTLPFRARQPFSGSRAPQQQGMSRRADELQVPLL